MSTSQLCDRVGIEAEDNDSFEPIRRREVRPMPVHRSRAAIRAGHRSEGHSGKRRKRPSNRSNMSRRRRRKML